MKNKECLTFIPLLDDYAQGLLEPNQAERVREHCARCPVCRRSYEETKALISLLRKDGLPDPGESFWTGMTGRIMREVRQGVQETPRAPWYVKIFRNPFGWPGYAWAAALLLLVLTPLVLIEFGDFGGKDRTFTVSSVPRPMAEEDSPLGPRPESLSKMMAALSEKEAVRLAAKMTSRLVRIIPEESEYLLGEEKTHWDMPRTLEGLEAEELEALSNKMDPGKSAGLKEEETYAC